MKKVISRGCAKLRKEGYSWYDIESFMVMAFGASNEMEIVLLLAEMTGSDISSIEAEIL